MIFLNSWSALENANKIFFSIISLDLNKGPKIKNKLLAIILDNFKPTILKIINKKNIKKIEENILKVSYYFSNRLINSFSLCMIKSIDKNFISFLNFSGTFI